MPIPAWRAAQTTNTTGTGTLVLNASPVGRRSFLAAFGAGSTRITYVIQGTTFFEIGLGDFDGGTPGNLTRVTVLTSSNSNALVSLPVGVSDVFTFIDPAARVVLTGTGAITAALTDVGNLVHWTGTTTQPFNFPAITTVPPGQGYLVTNLGTATLTLDPNASEQINSALTLVLLPGESADCYRSGAAWVAVVSLAKAASPPGRLLRVTRITTAGSGTWTRPSDVTSVLIRTVAGATGGTGGMSAWGNGTDAFPGVSGAAGGGGGSAELYVAAAAASYAYVVGAGGAGGAGGASQANVNNAGVAGSAGGATTIAGIAGGIAPTFPTGASRSFRGSVGPGGTGGNGGGTGGGVGPIGNNFGDGGAGGFGGLTNAAGGAATAGAAGGGGGGGGGGGSSGSMTQVAGGAGAAGGPGYIEIWEYA